MAMLSFLGPSNTEETVVGAQSKRQSHRYRKRKQVVIRDQTRHSSRLAELHIESTDWAIRKEQRVIEWEK